MSRVHTTLITLVGVLAGGCRRHAPEAPPSYSDAIVALFVQLEEDEETVAENLRAVERQIYLGMDVEAENAADRALEPSLLSEADVEGLGEYPAERDIREAIPISVGGLSPHPVDFSQILQLEVDHTAWEPYSPEHYVRSFLVGEDCWLDHGCTWMETWNELTKKNVLMTVEYAFYKDFRWVDMATEGPPRWAYVGRSWTPQSYAGDNEKSFIHQSYTIEIWIPRDGRGFVRSPKDKNVDGGEWTSDSNGSGALRMLTLWSETEFKGLAVSDDQVIATTRAGIDKNFKAADDYLSSL